MFVLYTYIYKSEQNYMIDGLQVGTNDDYNYYYVSLYACAYA